MAIRPLDQQFEPDTVKWINKLIERLSNMRYPEGVSSYYAKDLQVCLEAGALLSSLHLAVTLTEVIVRSLVIAYAMETLGPDIRKVQPTVETRLEEQRYSGFPGLLDSLVENDHFDSEDAKNVKWIYDHVRIPILHGLPGRFSRQYDPGWGMISKLLRWPGPTGASDFERIIEQETIRIIDLLIEIFERNL